MYPQYDCVSTAHTYLFEIWKNIINYNIKPTLYYDFYDEINEYYFYQFYNNRNCSKILVLNHFLLLTCKYKTSSFQNILITELSTNSNRGFLEPDRFWPITNEEDSRNKIFTIYNSLHQSKFLDIGRKIITAI